MEQVNAARNMDSLSSGTMRRNEPEKESGPHVPPHGAVPGKPAPPAKTAAPTQRHTGNRYNSQNQQEDDFYSYETAKQLKVNVSPGLMYRLKMHVFNTGESASALVRRLLDSELDHYE
jgi:hypothetical protein